MTDTKLLLIFIILNVANVIIQTIKSIATIKCGKTIAALINAIAYGLYTIVVVYMVCELPLWTKVAIVATANLIGVYVVKLFEEKMRKDKLWKVEVTFPHDINALSLISDTCKMKNIPMNWIDIDAHYICNFFCSTQKESAEVKELIKLHNGKYFVSESKVL